MDAGAITGVFRTRGNRRPDDVAADSTSHRAHDAVGGARGGWGTVPSPMVVLAENRHNVCVTLVQRWIPRRVNGSVFVTVYHRSLVRYVALWRLESALSKSRTQVLRGKPLHAAEQIWCTCMSHQNLLPRFD